MFGQRKIPTLLAIFVIVVTMVGLGFGFEKITRMETKASLSIEPTDVMITNLSDSSFTVTWQTDTPTTGSVLVSSNTGKKYSAFDERDMAGKMGTYTTHSVTVRSLSPATPYTLTILANGKKYHMEGYTVTTFSALQSPSAGLESAYGSIVLPSGVGAEHALVYVTLDGAQTLSTLVRTSGSWIIPFSFVRTSDGTSSLPLSERMIETIVVKLGSSESRVFTDTLNDSPVPDIVLGQSYDFRGRDAKKQTTQTIADTTLGKSVLGTTTEPTDTVTLLSPIQGANLTSNRPLITGTGISGKQVTVTLGITSPTVQTTTVAANGTWNVTPSQALEPGKQSVTITTVDANNKPVAITHTFTLLKSGTQVLGDATPSATLEPTPPTQEESTQAADLSGDKLPESGSILPTLLLLILGTALIVGGGVIRISQRP